jgi:hypothetical protein
MIRRRVAMFQPGFVIGCMQYLHLFVLCRKIIFSITRFLDSVQHLMF